MKIEKILLVVVIVVLVLWVVKGKCSEGFGQDASMRVAAGWVAGPDYGFDPVQEYADQLSVLRDQYQQQKLSKEKYTNMPSLSSGSSQSSPSSSAKTCNSCLNTEDFIY